MGSFRSRADGSHYPIHRRTLFGAPRSQQLSKEISIVNETEAHASVKQLSEQYESAGSRARRRQLVMAANQAANRAKVDSRNPNLHESTRREKAKVAEVYRKWVDEHRLTPKM